MPHEPDERRDEAGTDEALSSGRAYLIRHEERIAGTGGGGWRGVGQVRARKRVDRVRVDEVLAREVERLDGVRVPADEDDSGRIEHLPDGSISIPLFEEELVVTKRVVLRERMILRKGVERTGQRIRDELRRERVELDADAGVRDRVHGLGGDGDGARRGAGGRRAPRPAASAVPRAETKPSFLTSELVALLLVATALGIAAAMDDAIDAPLFLALLTAAVVLYVFSRGAAKSRTPSRAVDPREHMLARRRKMRA